MTERGGKKHTHTIIKMKTQHLIDTKNDKQHTDMQTSYILTKTYIPGDTLDSLTNTHIFIPADIEYKHIQRPYTRVRT